MHAWETLNLYCLQDQRWFDTLGSHAPAAEHLAVYRALMPDGWGLRRRGLWFIADPPSGDMQGQGFKLHVSAAHGETVEVLRRALGVLRDANVHFKFLLDPWSNQVTSKKSWPRGSSGKFITVYPDGDRFEAIGDALAAALDGLTGPYILSDRRYKDSKVVHYRYGGFKGISQGRVDGTNSLMIEAPDGSLVPDVRHAYWNTPQWIVDPLEPEPAASAGGPLGGRFTVTGAITFSNAGGVYRATDEHTGNAVLVKEARPHVLSGATAAQTIDVLEKEHRLLQELSDSGSFVQPVAFIREWEHAFLVEEFLDGQHLGQVSIAENPVCHHDRSERALREYYTKMRGIWRQIAAAIAAAHERGILLGDLSFTNVMLVDGARRVQIIDLEAAVREGVDEQLGIYTTGLASPNTVRTRRYDRANDYHGLGSLMLGSLMVVNNVVGYHRPALQRFLDALAADLALPADLVELITDLTSGEEPHPQSVLDRIDALDFDDPRLWTAPVALAQPAPAPTALLAAQAAQVVQGAARQIVATADPTRDDRLFPADVAVFETNPLSVAYGAMGILRALRRLTGEVPGSLLGWALRHDADSQAYPPGLYVGQSGIAWSLAELGEHGAARALLKRAAHHPLLLESADLMHGCAGYGLARLRMWQLDGAREHLDEARRIGAWLASSAIHDARGTSWAGEAGPDGERPVSVGYAYGSSGVALFLLYLHHATGDEAFYELGRAALDFDLAQGVALNDHARGYPSYASDAPELDNRVVRNYWDEGTAGVTTVALRYLASRPDDELRRTVIENLEDSSRKYANMPQLFHGLSGLGNVLLDAYELSGERQYLHEAWRTGEGVLLFAIDRPDGVAFTGEQSLRECSDFATGSAGVALFLDRLRRATPGGRTNFNFVLDDLLPAGLVALGHGEVSTAPGVAAAGVAS